MNSAKFPGRLRRGNMINLLTYVLIPSRIKVRDTKMRHKGRLAHSYGAFSRKACVKFIVLFVIL